VEEPCVSLLAACATKWFTDATKAGELRSGFYARLCMVASWTKTRHLPRGAAPDVTGRRDLIRQFARLRQASGEMALARAWSRRLESGACNSRRASRPGARGRTRELLHPA